MLVLGGCSELAPGWYCSNMEWKTLQFPSKSINCFFVHKLDLGFDLLSYFDFALFHRGLLLTAYLQLPLMFFVKREASWFSSCYRCSSTDGSCVVIFWSNRLNLFSSERSSHNDLRDVFCSQPNGNPFIILYLFLESVALFFEQADLYFKLFCLVQVRLAILGLPKLVILSLGRHSTAWPKFKLTARHLYSYFRVILSALWTDDWFFPWPGIFLE